MEVSGITNSAVDMGNGQLSRVGTLKAAVRGEVLAVELLKIFAEFCGKN